MDFKIKKITVNNNSIESFELFFKKFSSNQNFQEERIKFPLKTYSYDIRIREYFSTLLRDVQINRLLL